MAIMGSTEVRRTFRFTHTGFYEAGELGKK